MTVDRNMKPIGLKSTGLITARNIQSARKEKGFSIAELSRKLEEVGHRIPPLGLRRIEAAARRVDVDDLMALAVVLQTTPATLLFEDTTMRSRVDTQRIIPSATGLPEDITPAEAAAWGAGKLELTLEARALFLNEHLELLQNQREDFERLLSMTDTELESYSTDFSLPENKKRFEQYLQETANTIALYKDRLNILGFLSKVKSQS